MLNDFPIKKEPKLILRYGSVQDRLKFVSSELRNDFISQVTKRDGSKACKRGGIVTLGDKCDESRIESTQHPTLIYILSNFP